MQIRKIKNAKHKIFDNIKEFESYFMEKDGVVPPLITKWRESKAGDWVLADDGGVAQVLRVAESKMRPGERIIYTSVGTFLTKIPKNPKTLSKMPYFMDTDLSKHENRTTFNGKRNQNNMGFVRKKTRAKEAIFALKFVLALELGIDPVDVVRDVYGRYKDPQMALKMLLKNAEVRNLIMENIRKIAKDSGYTDEYIFKKLDKLINESKDPRVTLEAIQQFGKIIGTIQNETAPTKGLPGGFGMMFQGFRQRTLDEVQEIDIEEDGESES